MMKPLEKSRARVRTTAYQAIPRRWKLAPSVGAHVHILVSPSEALPCPRPGGPCCKSVLNESGRGKRLYHVALAAARQRSYDVDERCRRRSSQSSRLGLQTDERVGVVEIEGCQRV
jgi:hypothetical protein